VGQGLKAGPTCPLLAAGLLLAVRPARALRPNDFARGRELRPASEAAASRENGTESVKMNAHEASVEAVTAA
jgi:hypothetical protein